MDDTAHDDENPEEYGQYVLDVFHIRFVLSAVL